MSDLLDFNPKEAAIDDLLQSVGISRPASGRMPVTPAGSVPGGSAAPTLAPSAPGHHRSLSAQFTTGRPPPSPMQQSRPLGETRATSAADFADLDPFRKLSAAPAPSPAGAAPAAAAAAASAGSGVPPQSPVAEQRGSQGRAGASTGSERARVDTPPQMTPDGYPIISIPGSQEWDINFHEIKLLDKIAEGGFGEVYKGTFRGKVVAVKTVKMHVIKKDPKFVRNFTTEISTWVRLRHPNIVQFMAACLKLPEACIVCEFMPRGTVYDVLHSQMPISWEMIKRWALDVALAMNYMHLCRPPIIHRDLKSANLLLAEDWSVKLTDFGLSRTVEGTAHMSVVGTTAWTAPEVLASQPYGTKADVFSFGILLWEFVTRAVPYAGTDPVQVAVAVVNQQIRPPIPPSCPAPLAQLMQACWHQNPDMRPSFNEIVFQIQQLP